MICPIRTTCDATILWKLISQIFLDSAFFLFSMWALSKSHFLYLSLSSQSFFIQNVLSRFLRVPEAVSQSLFRSG